MLGLVVVFVGLISTETYYAGFGVRYQDLGLSATHLLYRGLTTLIDAWELAGLYLIAIAWLATSDAIARRIGKMRAMGISYALVIALAVGAYPLARRAGFAEARRDMMRETSTLETVECLSFERGTCQPEYRRYKHLITSGGEVLLFNPVPRGQTASFPVLVHLPQGDIHELRTSPTR